MESEHADILNELDAMSRSPLYVLRRDVLKSAEALIIQLETELKKSELKMDVTKAQRLNICRICRQPANPRMVAGSVDAFVYNFGREHAHASCITKEANGPQ